MDSWTEINITAIFWCHLGFVDRNFFHVYCTITSVPLEGVVMKSSERLLNFLTIVCSFYVVYFNGKMFVPEINQLTL